jgi:crotonobetainyl-CoA:carnitine CoA-transferase CaiB-like acyl-CoA transferase
MLALPWRQDHPEVLEMPSSPLAGTLVIDLSRHLPGPLAAQLLASLGAR